MEKAKRVSSRLGQPNPPHNQVERLKHLRECCDLMVSDDVYPSVAKICSSSGIPRTTLRQKPFWGVVLAIRAKIGICPPDENLGGAKTIPLAASPEDVAELTAKLLVLSARLRDSDKDKERLKLELREANEKLELLAMPAHPARPLVGEHAASGAAVPYWA